MREECPWDRKQTIHSLRPQTIEEIYELSDTIANEDWKGIKEELGDLLLHIVFYSKIGAEQNQFTLDDVIAGVCNKLINRHPHIYGNVKLDNETEVKQNWEKIKQAEGKKSILSGVPPSMPALVKALRLQEKTKTVGFEWDRGAGQPQGHGRRIWRCVVCPDQLCPLHSCRPRARTGIYQQKIHTPLSAYRGIGRCRRKIAARYDPCRNGRPVE